MMNKETMIARLLNATPAELKKVAAVFNGDATEGATDPGDRRLLSIAQAAVALGVSRTTIWRLLRDGRLPVVELRPGSRRVPSAAITELVRKGVCA